LHRRRRDGQRSAKTNKEAKKPKKDTSPPKAPSGGEPVRATIVTAVIPRGKIKNK